MTNNTGNTSPLETKAEFARRLGVNRSTVTRGVQQGRILVNGKGLVLINESLARWQATKVGRYDVEARHAKKRGQALNLNTVDAILNADTDLEIDSTETGEITHYKARALNAKNQIALLQIALDKGELTEKYQHLSAAYKLGAGIRQGIERTIDNIAPQITHAGTGDIEDMIENAINELFEVTL